VKLNSCSREFVNISVFTSSSQSQSHITTDDQSVSKSWCRAATTYLLLFTSYGLVFYGAPSLTRGRICLLYMMLALARAFFLEFESHGTCDHILLSQI
jgi:hypothetical protein